MFDFNQFIIVELRPDPAKPGKWLKIPMRAPHFQYEGSALDPANWMSYEQACEASYSRGRLQVAFVLTDNDPFFCIDIDGCLSSNPDSSGGGMVYSPTAVDISKRFPHCYQEVSVSGTGMHIFGSYTTIPPHSCKNTKLNLELYHTGRFIVINPRQSIGDPYFDATAHLPPVINYYFKPVTGEVNSDFEWTYQPVKEWSGPEDDDELIDLALKKRSNAAIFGGRVSFKDLWDRNQEALENMWPRSDEKGEFKGGFDESSADAALAQHLAYYTGRNCERVQRLMWKSGLVRDKWYERNDYLPRTVLNACKKQERILQVKKDPAADGIDRQFSGGFITTDEMPDLFGNLIWVRSRKQYFRPDGRFFDKDNLRMEYRGYTFETPTKSTTCPWDALLKTGTLHIEQADDICFRPNLEPAQIIGEANYRRVNVYVPPVIPRVPGDPSRFLRLVKTTYPHGDDAEIIISFMAALFQYPGKKFQWAPLLQGPEGSGKSFLLAATRRGLGPKYTHLQEGSALKNNTDFNAWIHQKIFIGVEEADFHANRTLMNNLKTMITNSEMTITPKGVDSSTKDNVANFMLTTNYYDALAIDRDQRRWCPLACEYQDKTALMKAFPEGGEVFFKDLYDWAKAEDSYADQEPGYYTIAHFLENYSIPDHYNPATKCIRAPMTSSYDKFVAYSRTRAEQEVIEAIEENRPGFAFGFVSSISLDRFLKQNRMNTSIPPAKRDDFMERLGYILHPALKDKGRPTGGTQFDQGRPKIYIRRGHPIHRVQEPRVIRDTYDNAQKRAQRVIIGEEEMTTEDNIVSLYGSN